jgi:hypothetical protein
MAENMVLSEILFVIGAITAVGSFFYAMYRIARRIDNAIGVDSQGRTLSERMDKVEYQLWPNNGSSLADKVDRLDKNMTENNSEVRIVKELVMIMVQSHQETTEKKPRSKKSLKSVN